MIHSNVHSGDIHKHRETREMASDEEVEESFTGNFTVAGHPCVRFFFFFFLVFPSVWYRPRVPGAFAADGDDRNDRRRARARAYRHRCVRKTCGRCYPRAEFSQTGPTVNKMVERCAAGLRPTPIIIVINY